MLRDEAIKYQRTATFLDRCHSSEGGLDKLGTVVQSIEEGGIRGDGSGEDEYCR
jgi:hypothetical protein